MIIFYKNKCISLVLHLLALYEYFHEITSIINSFKIPSNLQSTLPKPVISINPSFPLSKSHSFSHFLPISPPISPSYRALKKKAKASGKAPNRSGFGQTGRRRESKGRGRYPMVLVSVPNLGSKDSRDRKPKISRKKERRRLSRKTKQSPNQR